MRTKLTPNERKVLEIYTSWKSSYRREAANKEGIDDDTYNTCLDDMTDIGIFQKTKNGQYRIKLDYWQIKRLLAEQGGTYESLIESAKSQLSKAIKAANENTCCFNTRDFCDRVSYARTQLEGLKRSLPSA